MATGQNLAGLGMPVQLAARVGMHVQALTCAGTSAGSANQMPGRQGIYYVNASNSGSGVALAQVGGQGAGKGQLLGDSVIIANLLGATIYVYANANAAGSAVTLIGEGTSIAGTTGASLASGNNIQLWPITISTWIYDRVSV